MAEMNRFYFSRKPFLFISSGSLADRFKCSQQVFSSKFTICQNNGTWLSAESFSQRRLQAAGCQLGGKGSSHTPEKEHKSRPVVCVKGLRLVKSCSAVMRHNVLRHLINHHPSLLFYRASSSLSGDVGGRGAWELFTDQNNLCREEKRRGNCSPEGWVWSKAHGSLRDVNSLGSP